MVVGIFYATDTLSSMRLPTIYLVINFFNLQSY